MATDRTGRHRRGRRGVAVTVVSNRSPKLGAFLLTLPLVSLLAFVSAWYGRGDLPGVSRPARETLVLVPLGLPFFVPLAFAQRLGFGFWPAFLAGLALASAPPSGCGSGSARRPSKAGRGGGTRRPARWGRGGVVLPRHPSCRHRRANRPGPLRRIARVAPDGPRSVPERSTPWSPGGHATGSSGSRSSSATSRRNSEVARAAPQVVLAVLDREGPPPPGRPPRTPSACR